MGGGKFSEKKEIENMKILGGCFCGAVQYEADIDKNRIGVCHCRDCQKFSGSAFRLRRQTSASHKETQNTSRKQPIVVRSDAWLSAVNAAPTYVPCPETPTPKAPIHLFELPLRKTSTTFRQSESFFATRVCPGYPR
jgi:hypothetical protein